MAKTIIKNCKTVRSFCRELMRCTMKNLTVIPADSPSNHVFSYLAYNPEKEKNGEEYEVRKISIDLSSVQLDPNNKIFFQDGNGRNFLTIIANLCVKEDKKRQKSRKRIEKTEAKDFEFLSL